MLFTLLSWKKQDCRRRDISFFKFKLQSKFTPRFRTSELGSIRVSWSKARGAKSVYIRVLDIGRNWVLLEFSLRQFELMKSLITWKHLCTLTRAHDSWDGGNDTQNWVSSAYKWQSTPSALRREGNSRITQLNKTGPKTRPRGTPTPQGMEEDKDEWIRTFVVRPVKYDWISFRARPVMLKLDCSLSRSWLWLIVSNAAERSSKMRNTWWPLSSCFRIEE